MTSLRKRLMLTAAAVLVVVFVLMAGVLHYAFDRAVRAHSYAELDDRIRWLVRVLHADADGKLSLTRLPQDPRFDVVAGGLYWQIATADSVVLRSRSLGAQDLNWPAIWPPIGSRRSAIIGGSENQELLAMERAVAIETPTGHVEARIMVAIDDAELVEARQGFLAAIVPSLVAILLLLVAGLLAFLKFGLSPLSRIQAAMAAVRAGTQSTIAGTFAQEVQPLVDEANALIAARAQDLVDARARAGDLAHAIKTPLAVIDVHVRKLRSEGRADIADPVALELGHVDRVIRRELARARANIHAADRQRRTEVLPVLERTCGALSKLGRGRELHFEIDCDRSVQVLIDDTDLLEIMGNLVENATKWARSTVRVVSQAGEGGALSITVSDDGPGLSTLDILAVQARGVRLDQTVQGTGLGLGIVRDICGLYGGELVLGRSEAGGLSASVVIPASRVV